MVFNAWEHSQARGAINKTTETFIIPFGEQYNYLKSWTLIALDITRYILDGTIAGNFQERSIILTSRLFLTLIAGISNNVYRFYRYRLRTNYTLECILFTGRLYYFFSSFFGEFFRAAKRMVIDSRRIIVTVIARYPSN